MAVFLGFVAAIAIGVAVYVIDAWRWRVFWRQERMRDAGHIERLRQIDRQFSG